MAEHDSEEERDNTSLEPTAAEAEHEEAVGEEEEEPLLPPEVLESMPPDERKVVMRAFASMTRYTSPVLNPILRRVKSEHVTRIIDYTESENIRRHDADASERRYQFAYFLIGLAATTSLLVFFAVREQYDMLAAIITGVLGFGGGFGVGRTMK